MRYLIPLMLALAAAGCSPSGQSFYYDNRLPLAPDYGNAVQRNMAVQVVNPQPPPKPDAETNGQRMTDAVDRYRTGKVYPPQPPIESTVPMGQTPAAPAGAATPPAAAAP